MSDESLDNLFKKGLSEGNVPFNMESWRKMEQMLPAEKKPAGFVFGATAAIVAGVVVLATSVLLWNFYDSSSESQDLAQTEQSTSSIQQEATSSLSENQEVFSNASESNSESDLVAAETTLEIVEPNASGASSASTSSPSSKPAKEIVYSSQMPSKIETTNNASKARITKTSLNSGNMNQFFAQNDGFDDMRVTSEESQAFTMESGDLTSVDNIESAVGFSLEEQDDHTLFAEVGDSKLPTVNKNQFGFIGGLSFNSDLVSSGQSSMGSSELFGFSYQRFLKGGLSVHADLLYAPRNAVNATTTHTSQVFDFGKVDVNTTVSCERLVYLELPVMMSYNMGNHNVLAGASVSYLMDAQAKISDEFMYPSESVVEDRMEWGHKDGFNPLDVALMAGYEYSIKPKWNVGMRFNYGLLDVTKNDHFKNDSFDNNMQFRVYLKFSPFRF